MTLDYTKMKLLKLFQLEDQHEFQKLDLQSEISLMEKKPNTSINPDELVAYGAAI